MPPPGPSPSGPTHAGAQPYAPTTVTVTRPTQEKNSDTDKKGKRSSKPLLIAFTIVAVLFLILGASGTFYVLDRFGYLTFQADGPDDVVAEQDPSPSPTQSADPEADRTEPDTEESREEPTEESVPGSDEMLLTQMDPVETQNGGWGEGRAEMDGDSYNRALRTTEGCFRGCVAWAEYNLGRDWDSFTATIGLDDNSRSGQSVTFAIYLDDEVEWRETATLGEVLDVEVDVSDALRMRLETEIEADDVMPIWADPTVFGT